MREKAWRLLEDSLSLAEQLGVRHVTAHLWDALSPDEQVAAPSVDGIGDIVTKVRPWVDRGLSFSIELLPTRGSSVPQLLPELERRLAEPVKYTLDLEFAAYQDFLMPLVGRSARLSNVHVKDYDGRMVDDQGRRRYCPLGSGSLDLTDIFRRLRSHGFAGLCTIESPAMSMPHAREMVDYVRRCLGAVNG